MVLNGSTTQEGLSWGSEKAAQLSELFYDAAFKAWGCLNSPDYEMSIPEQNEYNTTPPSTDTEQQSLAGSLSSQPSSSATKSRKPRSERQSRHKWSDEDKKTLMTLYCRSDPSKSGYRRHLHSLWKHANLFPRTEQQLADQARSIQQNNLLSDIDLLEIRGSVSIATV